jgi:hypothetical protein
MNRAIVAPPPESHAARAIKVLLHIAALGLIFWPLVTTAGLVAGAVGVVLATTLAFFAHRAHLRALPALILALLAAALFGWLSSFVRDSVPIASSLGYASTLALSDVLFAGLMLPSLLFVVRLFAQRWAVASVIEVLAIAFSATYVFIDHRYLNLNHPRFFADWLLSQGLDPTVVLKAMGVAIMVVAVIMLLRSQGVVRGWLSMLLAAAVGLLVFLWIKDDPPIQPANPPTTALAGGDEEADAKEDPEGEGGGGQGDGEGQGGGGGGEGQGGQGQGTGRRNKDGQSPYKNPPNSKDPQPVALVTFHDDIESKDGILYFRQQVLSSFNASHLAADASGQHDRDVMQTFPLAGPVESEHRQEVGAHVRVPTSMFLMVDHPQPVALSHAVSLAPRDNPNPRLFVAAYEVMSLMPSTDWSRLLGRTSGVETWTDEQRAHYLAHPDDPRYVSLAHEILRDLDPRFLDDSLMKALTIKRYLEKEGFYTLKEKYESEADPTAAFLFGTMRGYCVHFAHSAAFLFRTVGIASRVAVGYAVDTSRRGTGSSMLILGNQAHAWPEIYLDGIGWVTFDIYPERSDQPPQQIIDQDLANMLGEIARDDPSGGRASNPERKPFPWAMLGWVALIAAGGALALSYLVKLGRRLAPSLASPETVHRAALRALTDALADAGLVRDFGETREGFARRVGPLAPSLGPLTMLHLRAALGAPRTGSGPEREAERTRIRGLLRDAQRELRKGLPWHRRLLAALNPVGWFRAR